ncbi:MAG: translation initiation factor IF-3 [Eubacteriales bacterium]
MEVFLIKELTINDDIRAKEVRLISSNGDQLGVVAFEDALNNAYDEGLDLVLMSPNATPPVCKIMDYGKYRFEQAKREKEAKKNQTVIEIKEVRLSPSIEEHDINVRVKNAIKFLKQGNKVKVSIRFKGRQMAHTALGFEVMNDFASRLEGECVVESKPKLEGRNMMMMLSAETKKK